MGCLLMSKNADSIYTSRLIFEVPIHQKFHARRSCGFTKMAGKCILTPFCDRKRSMCMAA